MQLAEARWSLEMAAAAYPDPKRIETILPFAHAELRRQAVLDE